MTHEEVQKIVKEIADAWNARDLDRCLSFLTEDVVWRDPAMTVPAENLKAVRDFSQSLMNAFPDFHYAIRDSVCVSQDKQRCALPWRITGTHLGILDPPGFRPTGQRAEFEGVDMLTFRDQKVCRIDTFFDVAIPAEQLLRLRLRPKAGSLQERFFVWMQRLRAFWVRIFHKTPS